MATAYAPEPEENLPDGGAMSDSELAAHLSEHETRAIGYFESEIASEQAEAMERYYRRPYGDEQVGRSQYVDGTVAITVDNAIAALLKPFVSSDEVVSFEPEGPEDEEEAKQATDYINYVFHCDNPGFLILHDWFKDACLQKLGVVKGTRIGLLLPNTPYYPIAYFGILKTGAAVVPLNVLLKPREIAQHLRDSAACAYLCHEGTAELPMAQMGHAAFGEVESCEQFVVMTKDATADLMVIPRCRSRARESVWVLPASTLPISSMTPAAKSSRSVKLVLPAST